MDEKRLSALRPGDRATIGRVDGSGPVRRRLLELGLTPGTAVTLVRLAPLMDPLEIRVRGYQLCVRRSEADAVAVRLDPAGDEHGGTEARRGFGERATERVPDVAGDAASPSLNFSVSSSPIPPISPSPSVSPCLRVASLALAPLRALRRR